MSGVVQERRPRAEVRAPVSVTIAADRQTARRHGAADARRPAQPSSSPRFRMALMGLALAAALVATWSASAPPWAAPATHVVLADADRVGPHTYRLWLVDVADADGDVVAVDVNGRRYGEFVITHQPQPVLVTAPSRAVPSIAIVALRDGSARNLVTLGVRTTAGQWKASHLAEGQRQHVPLLVRR